MVELFESQQADEIAHVRFANEWINAATTQNARTVLDIGIALAGASKAFHQVMGAEATEGVELSRRPRRPPRGRLYRKRGRAGHRAAEPAGRPFAVGAAATRMTDARGDRTAQALSAFLVDRAHLLLPLAAQLGETTEVESNIRGSSMAPAIPPWSRLRVRVGGQIPCEVGDVVFFLADDGYTAHRVVYRDAGRDDISSPRAMPALRPTLRCRASQVLGTVVAVEIGGQWLPVAGPPVRPWRQRVVRTRDAGGDDRRHAAQRRRRQTPRGDPSSRSRPGAG